jgi:hypothetical protein
MPTNEHGHQVDEDWEPENPVLRGQTQVPDQMPLPVNRLDELPHRERVRRGLNDEEPDPGYDPDEDDVVWV